MGGRPFRLGGWVGSELFDDRLSSHECGCELAEKARRSRDANESEIAERQARSWDCPNVGGAGNTQDEAALAVLDVIAELCEVERGCLRTCPRWHALQPDVVRATQFRQYVEAGCPETIESNPSVVLIRASHLVSSAEAARVRAERKEWSKKHERRD